MRFRRNPSSAAVLFCLVVVLAAGTQVLFVRGALAESDVKDDFRRLAVALQDADEEETEKALETIVRSGGPKRMQKLLSLALKLPSGHDSLYWTLLSAVAGFVDRPSLTGLGETIVRHKSSPIAADLLYALARNRTRNVPAALCPVLEGGTLSLQIQAAEQLGYLRVPAAVDCLIEALKAEEKKGDEPSVLAGSVIESLTEITGKRFGFNSVNWEGWWKKHRDEPLLGEKDTARTVTGTAVDTLDARRRRAYLALKEAPKKGIVVLSALYKRKDKVKNLNNDDMEKVLERMGIPHTVVPREEFLDFDLRETGAILINCAKIPPSENSKGICVCPTCIPSGEKVNRLYKCSGCDRHEPIDTTLEGAQLRKLQRFVRRGGYLFCEDWVVKEVLEPGFPRYVEAGQKLSQGVVDVVPLRGLTRHPYLEGIFVPPPPEDDFGGYELATELELDLDFDEDDEEEEPGTEKSKGKTVVAEVPEVAAKEDEVPDPEPEIVALDFQWKIDDESFALHVVDPGKVMGLLGSGGLKERVGNDFLVALAFRPGSSLPVGQRSSRPVPGVILQVLSHFGRQGSGTNERSLENLLLNFLIDANTARRSRTGSR